jgi:anti-sigma B factor antagonist
VATRANLLIQTIRDATIVNFQDTSILDTLQVQQIGDEIYGLVDTMNRKKLVLDFSKVRFLSSSALGVLITLRKKSEAIKGKVVLCGLRSELMKVFQISRLDKLFEFCDNEEDALAGFGITTAG